jgi:ABC-type Mn2+/Zn2+ transport system permease subunit
MRALEYFASMDEAWAFVIRPLLVASVLVIMSGVLSVIVVLKRLAFAGQGISHAAFGGIGLAAVTTTTWMIVRGGDPGSARAVGVGQGGWIELAIVMLFCITASVLIARLSNQREFREDTGIGLLLVASMALGGVLVDLSRHLAQTSGLPASSRSWESVLFGSMLLASNSDLIFAIIVAALMVLMLLMYRRWIMMWVLDESSCSAFGVPAGFVRGLIMGMLAVCVVTSTKLAGVVPATALLVLPGAIGLRLSRKGPIVIMLSIGLGLLSVAIALWLSLELNLQPGPSLVMVMTSVYIIAWLLTRRAARP